MARVRHIPARSLHVSKPVWWLRSLFHFSFAEHWYNNPLHNQWGVLRVLNDDLVKPQAGFGAHGHRDAEIFSYVLEGELTHQDSMANKEALARGAIQYMSAGRGVRHSEMNDHPTDTVRLLQVWLLPEAKGLTPQYGSRTFSKAQRHNKLLQLLGGTGAAAPPGWTSSASSPAAAAADGGDGNGDLIRLQTDANVFAVEADAGWRADLLLPPRRQVYLVAAEGDGAIINGTRLAERDAAAITGADDAPTRLQLQFAGDNGAHLLLIEMAKA